ncbi:MAG: hypothetical protein IH948_07385 [Bacteroidetes bacterium]|nr:hypothetical protein [Bacteroidota bacterium]
MAITLAEKLKERRKSRTAVESPLFGMREKILAVVKEEVSKFKAEVMEELQELLQSAQEP